MGSNPTLSASKTNGALAAPFVLLAECGCGSRTLFDPVSAEGATGHTPPKAVGESLAPTLFLIPPLTPAANGYTLGYPLGGRGNLTYVYAARATPSKHPEELRRLPRLRMAGASGG